MSHPQRLLEVTINSAHDLPPMAKMLRTFVVAWVNPDNKLSTRVDHHGHTNPTWNDKLLFRVDDDFLRSDSSSVMMVIYNLAWLRDLPMGTTNLNIGQILKTLTHKNQALRNITLHIKRPTGHLQGTLNVSVNIVGYPLPTSTPETQLPTASKTPSKEYYNQPKQETLLEQFDHLELESKIGVENEISQPKLRTLSEVFHHLELEKQIGVDKKMRQPKEGTLTEVFDHLELERKIGVRQPKEETLSEVFESLDLERKVGLEKNNISQNKICRRSITNSMDSSNADSSPLADTTISAQKSETASKTKTKTISSNDSLFPQMKTLPSDMKKGSYSHSPGSSTRKDLFENWTEAGSSERNTWRSKSPRWGVDHQPNNMLITPHIGEKPKPKPKQRKKSSNEKGLLSCFGNFNGFQFKMFCGSKNGKKKRKSKYEYKDPILTTTDQSLRSFQF